MLPSCCLSCLVGSLSAFSMPSFLFKQKVVKIRLSWVVFISDGPLDRDEPPDGPPDHRTDHRLTLEGPALSPRTCLTSFLAPCDPHRKIEKCCRFFLSLTNFNYFCHFWQILTIFSSIFDLFSPFWLVLTTFVIFDSFLPCLTILDQVIDGVATAPRWGKKRNGGGVVVGGV